MNYLAHLRLAKREENSIIGNLMGDFCRHLNGMELPAAVRDGITNHRRVDRFTDSHSVVCDLKGIFSRKRRRYAGIILDLAFDHFLSIHWNNYSMDTREEFIEYSYSCLARGLERMPERMRMTVSLMIQEDWLGSYKQLSGIDIAINRLSRRIRFENCLEGAVEEVESNYEIMEEGFQTFFPSLINHMSQDA